jgi:nitroreductase/threonine dehydratase
MRSGSKSSDPRPERAGERESAMLDRICEEGPLRKAGRSSLKLENAILGRRSVRRYKPDPVAEEVVREILELARHAPSSMNGQPWEFVVVEDRAVLVELGAIKDRYCPPAKREFKATMFASAPLALVVCVDRSSSHDRVVENGVLASAYLMLAAHARGLGSVYLSAQRADEPRLAQAIRELLGIPDHVDPVTLVPLGYPDEAPQPKSMKSLKVFRGAYGEESVPELRAIMDRDVPASESLVLRYIGAGASIGAEHLRRTSIREGARSFPLLTHREVEIHVLDETSLMHTHSFKALDGCITSAHCLKLGLERVVFESGGNTAAALTSYCRRVGIETFCFVPRANMASLDSRVFSDDHAHLIAVEDRHRVKQAARRFAEDRKLPLVPETAWRFEASTFRGYFVLELLLEGLPFDGLVQAISAAFGPIGIYRVLASHATELANPPRFLGVQQQANCPMFTAWRRARGDAAPPAAPDAELLIKTMYDREPQTHGTYESLEKILVSTGGDLTTISGSEFARLLERRFDGGSIVERLADRGLQLAQRNGEFVEKAGLVALAGLVKEIDRGHFQPGSRVLCSFSGGTSLADGLAKEDAYVDGRDEASSFEAGGLSRA